MREWFNILETNRVCSVFIYIFTILSAKYGKNEKIEKKCISNVLLFDKAPDDSKWRPKPVTTTNNGFIVVTGLIALFVSFCMMKIKNFTKDFEKNGAIDCRQGLKFEKLHLTVYKNWRKFWQGHTLSINPINKF